MRPKSKIRLEDITDAAMNCFANLGYRRTQMADIAKQAGTSAGTLYLYAEGKEALLHLAILRSVGVHLNAIDLPAKTPSTKATIEAAQAAISGLAMWPALLAVLEKKRISDKDVVAIGEEFYDLLASNRQSILLFDQLAEDLPGFNNLRDQDTRGAYLTDLSALLRRLHPKISSVQERFVARAANELMAWAAMHRLTEQSADDFRDLPETTVRSLAAHAFAATLTAKIVD